jgi:hypothetical protein
VIGSPELSGASVARGRGEPTIRAAVEADRLYLSRAAACNF